MTRHRLDRKWGSKRRLWYRNTNGGGGEGWVARRYPKRSLNDGTDESSLLLAFCIIYLREHSSSDVRLKLCSSGVLAAVFELRQEPLCKLYQPRGPQTNLHRPEVRIGLADFWFWYATFSTNARVISLCIPRLISCCDSTARRVYFTISQLLVALM